MPGPRRISALTLQIVCLLGGASAALALPPPAPPNAPPPRSTTAAPSANPGIVLPVGSALSVVLDDRISSRLSLPNSTVRYHLKDALVVGGVTIAAAGSPGTLTVAHKAIAPDQDGTVQIALSPLQTAFGLLPVRPVHDYLAVSHTAGQLDTRATTDQAVDIFLPPYVLYQVLRRGQDLVVPEGSVLRILTAATISAANPKAIEIMTPAPFILSTDPIHSDFTPIPLATVPPVFHRQPTPRPEMATAAPTPAPTASPTPAASALPTTTPPPALPTAAPSA
ncbi:MAG TPA: hypothetical protein VME66_04255 [Candidatus Acidoferrales bacterium]|nr:hypothetical protein [Candidatus Acidoferrales bacterium]